MFKYIIALLIAVSATGAAAQDEYLVRQVEIVEWKSVFGRIETRDRVPARTRLGGTLIEVSVTEGATVEKGRQIATVVDEKLNLQLGAVEAMISALQSQLENAQAELQRGQDLLDRGVATVQQLDQLRTQVDVLVGQIDKARADRDVLKQRETEGAVLAPLSGKILNVPVTEGSVVQAGEVVAEIGGGGFFLRLAVPERHADFLEQGAEIRIGGGDDETSGTLAKIYPLVESGRVVADVEVDDIATEFVDARVLVRLPVGRTNALMVPSDLVSTRMGLDFVTVMGTTDAPIQRTVALGTERVVDGVPMVEILSGLRAGAMLVTSHE